MSAEEILFGTAPVAPVARPRLGGALRPPRAYAALARQYVDPEAIDGKGLSWDEVRVILSCRVDSGLCAYLALAENDQGQSLWVSFYSDDQNGRSYRGHEGADLEPALEVYGQTCAFIVGDPAESKRATLRAVHKAIAAAADHDLQGEPSWYEQITSLKIGDECDYRFPAVDRWHRGIVRANGGDGFWRVRDVDSGKEVGGLYSEYIKAPGGRSYEDG